MADALPRAAQQARDAKLAFKVTAYKPELKEFVGRVESIAVVEGVKPVTWQIIMRTTPA